MTVAREADDEDRGTRAFVTENSFRVAFRPVPVTAVIRAPSTVAERQPVRSVAVPSEIRPTAHLGGARIGSIRRPVGSQNSGRTETEA